LNKVYYTIKSFDWITACQQVIFYLLCNDGLFA